VLRLGLYFGTLTVSTWVYKAVNWRTDESKPLPKWKYHFLRVYARSVARTLLFALGFVWIRERNKQYKHSDARVIVGNHTG
jgi:hypothetical protein